MSSSVTDAQAVVFIGWLLAFNVFGTVSALLTSNWAALACFLLSIGLWACLFAVCHIEENKVDAG